MFSFFDLLQRNFAAFRGGSVRNYVEMCKSLYSTGKLCYNGA